MKSQTTRGAFSPLMLIIETPYEYDAIMLALRIGADGIRQIEQQMQTKGEPVIDPHLQSKCVEFARSLLDNPEVMK